jgi:hypothetical protein
LENVCIKPEELNYENELEGRAEFLEDGCIGGLYI